ncbi:hypothetical protein CY34DRAFT_810099 [Suillus luteus UH-Slu-Lm8-n1]|uniref:Uncharacterized protein n=1 Tax=Suillus luteus UH-Slu-Lm8-n1 TaxID=930992 RepID=A0A0D0AHV5_9AGAM|nr:hypothetical protein CY34DRAFT_810099 [Suillus luteus UH-Slu-Lm8-n1]
MACFVLSSLSALQSRFSIVSHFERCTATKPISFLLLCAHKGNDQFTKQREILAEHTFPPDQEACLDKF